MTVERNDEANSDLTRPFEWLTSPSSLQSLLLSVLTDDEGDQRIKHPKRVLHVGCGSSLTGEMMVEDPIYNVSTVVNVDCDQETLQRMKNRWKQRHGEDVLEGAMQFLAADFSSERALEESCGTESFDLVMDKSALDCLLCSDTAAIGLLTETYRVLKPGGVYLVISFHHADFFQPLLENLPGADWEVSCSVLMRQVEDLFGGVTGKTTATVESTADQRWLKAPGTLKSDTLSVPKGAATWATGTFEPDEHYRRTVNVLHCRKRQSVGLLDWDAVYRHVHDTNNQWYSHANPMLTAERTKAIELAFDNDELDLSSSYQILFTDAERENLEYEDFVGDWEVFLRSHPDVPVDRMSSAAAVAFMDAMQ